VAASESPIFAFTSTSLTTSPAGPLIFQTHSHQANSQEKISRSDSIGRQDPERLWLTAFHRLGRRRRGYATIDSHGRAQQYLKRYGLRRQSGSHAQSLVEYHALRLRSTFLDERMTPRLKPNMPNTCPMRLKSLRSAFTAKTSDCHGDT
jgi:hypothetical protein